MRRSTALPFVLVASLAPSLALADKATDASAAEPPASDATEAADATAADAPRGTLLVLDLVDRGAGQELADTLSGALSGEAGRSSADEVITAQDLRTRLDAAALAALTGCDAEGCMQGLASAANADRVMGGSVALVGGDVVLTVVVVDAASGQRVGEAQRKAPAHPELARYAVRAVAAKALGAAALAEPVPVMLESDPPGARAFVDGASVGSTPVIAPLAPGGHEITFRADGFGEQRLGVTVEDGAPLVLRAQLTRTTVRLWPIAATLGGVALLSGAGAGWAGIAAANAYDGSFGFLTPEDDIAASYLHASPVDSVALAQKQQRVEQLGVLANALWITAAGVAAAAIIVEGVDLALWALSE